MKFVISIVLLVALLQPRLQASGKAHKSNESKCPEQGSLQEEERFSDFVGRVYRGGEDLFDGCVQVLRDDQVVLSKHTDAKFIIGNDINKGLGGDVSHPQAIPLGTDITGLRKPNLILGEWTGGAHCCFIFHVFELSIPVREIASIDAEDSDYAHFEDLDHDGIYEFVGWDYTFAYWRAAFLQSPAPAIVLRFDGSRYKLAPDLMSKPALSGEEFGRLQASVRENDAWKEGYPPPLLWGTMLDLIYSGHSDLAWKFIDGAWASEHTSKARFLRDFCTQLSTSPYFEELRPTITSAPCRLGRAMPSKKKTQL
jgi:hypothetical protein